MILKKGLGVRQGLLPAREPVDRFPGVTVERVFTRDYKQGTLAAHLFGNVGEVTAEQLKEPRYAGLQQGDTVGQSGIEYEYDRFLRGRPGATGSRWTRSAARGQLASKPAQAGDDVRLTIDSGLQATGEGALDSFGLPGAFVAMNAQERGGPGDGSAPTFDPSSSPPDHPEEYHALTSSRPTRRSRTVRSRVSIRRARPSR